MRFTCKHTLRNLILITAFTFFRIYSVFAQNAKPIDDNRFEFGLRISPVVSWVLADSKSLAAGGNSLDWNYGLTISKKINERYLWSTEINVMYMASKVQLQQVDWAKGANSGTGLNQVDLTYNQRYIEIPLLIKMRTNPIHNNIRIYGEFGIGNSFLYRNKADVHAANASDLNTSDMDVNNPDASDKFKIYHTGNTSEASIKLAPYRMSFIIGGGALFDINSSSKICAGLRYDGSLFDMMSDDTWSARNSFVGLNIGFIF